MTPKIEDGLETITNKPNGDKIENRLETITNRETPKVKPTKKRTIPKKVTISKEDAEKAEGYYNEGIKEINKKYFGLAVGAWKYFEKAIKIDESYINKVKEATSDFGRTKRERKKRQLFYFVATQRFPKDDYWYMMLGDSFRLQGDWHNTVKIFDKALAINPSAIYHNGNSLRQVRDSFNTKNYDGAAGEPGKAGVGIAGKPGIGIGVAGKPGTTRNR